MTVRGTIVRSEVCNAGRFCLESYIDIDIWHFMTFGIIIIIIIICIIIFIILYIIICIIICIIRYRTCCPLCCFLKSHFVVSLPPFAVFVAHFVERYSHFVESVVPFCWFCCFWSTKWDWAFPKCHPPPRMLILYLSIINYSGPWKAKNQPFLFLFLDTFESRKCL